MTDDEKDQIFFQMNGMIVGGNDDLALDLLNKNTFIATYFFEQRVQVLPEMARLGFPKTVARLIELGADVNYLHPDRNSSLPLHEAIRYGRRAVAEILLKNSADPNRERILLSAANCSHAEHIERVELVNLLVKYGARLNDLYAMFGDKKNLRTTLDFFPEGSEMRIHLRSLGAKTAKEVLSENPKAPISDE